MALLIDGKAIALEIQGELKAKIDALKARKPCLAVLIAGDHPPSHIYVNKKVQACASVGITSIKRVLPQTATEDDLYREIAELNANPAIDGILVQLPLPLHINPIKVTSLIAPEKDVDGLHPLNAGRILLGDMEAFAPCTPLGIQAMLMRSNIQTAGRHLLIIGRSNLVGKPLAALLMQNCEGGNATVTIAHSRTQNLQEIALTADIVVAAIGQPKFVTADMVREGSVLIDVGINKVACQEHPGYRIVGDIDFDAVKDKASAITPVPGGVGPMTIAMLLSNTYKAYSRE